MWGWQQASWLKPLVEVEGRAWRLTGSSWGGGLGGAGHEGHAVHLRDLLGQDLRQEDV